MNLLVRMTVLSAALIAILVQPQSGFGQEPAPKRPRILVTNDDGIASPRLAALVVELAKIGEVVVVAPDGNRSGASHSVTSMRDPTVVTHHEIPGAALAEAVSGTPADAVNFGLFRHGRDRAFDVCVSGVNRGSNAGVVAHLSGTVGAAMEAVYWGVPGVAVSTDSRQNDHALAARFAADFVRKLLDRGVAKGIGFTINIPAGDVREAVPAAMGGSYFRTTGYRRIEDATKETWRMVYEVGADGPEGCDTRQYYAGKITVTPIQIDWTAKDMLRKLSGWNLRVRR